MLRQAGTERPFTGEYTDTKTEGVYQCRACGAELFRSTEKFESHCGWPSFFDPADSDAVILRTDDSLGMRRVEVLCANCHSHLGHVFEGEGYPTPTDQRYCINSISLRLVPADCSRSPQRPRFASRRARAARDELLDPDPRAGEERRLLADVPARVGGAQVPHQVDDAVQLGRLERQDPLVVAERERRHRVGPHVLVVRGRPCRARPASCGARRRAAGTSPATARTGTRRCSRRAPRRRGTPGRGSC